ncbi:MAG: hypothetical protein SPF70_05785 [Lachnospiraceae bacterium]|nr:hypothetical protein [Lachnospiraceae bacterium]
MDAFFNYFYNFMNGIILSLWNILIAIKDALVTILDIKFYIDLFTTYRDDLSTGGWIAALVTHLMVLIILILLIYLIGRGLRVLFRFKVPVVEYEQMKDEIVALKRQVMKANYEKDKILAMKVTDLGMQVNPDLLDLENPEGQVQEEQAAATTEEELSEEDKVTIAAAQAAGEEVTTVKTGEQRFPKLNAVDAIYTAPDYVKPEYVNNYNLEELCTHFRNYAASRLGLYYELEVIRQVFASFGAAKMLILQGISGTGKTSLPYALGQFIQNPSLICSVQPSWRDRTELFGYYNDFTKKYSETEFLKTIYESHYQDDLRVVILDEMNIARVEYYFAEMLSILELPREEERYISVVSSRADNDPAKMEDGKIWIPSNVFYVGTINNDDSTFAVADKVYDRAIPIDLDDRATVFEAPDTEPMRIQSSYLISLYAQAKNDYPISEENLMQLDKLDQYLIEHFRLTFGNRILRQMKDFVPCYVACGGTELDGIDFMFAKKILRKFESLGLGFIRDEIDGLIEYLNHVYGSENFKVSKNYLLRLKKMSGS